MKASRGIPSHSVENYNQRYLTRCHLRFDKARVELEAMFSIN